MIKSQSYTNEVEARSAALRCYKAAIAEHGEAQCSITYGNKEIRVDHPDLMDGIVSILFTW
jgi:hypothetical protein